MKFNKLEIHRSPFLQQTVILKLYYFILCSYYISSLQNIRHWKRIKRKIYLRIMLILEENISRKQKFEYRIIVKRVRVPYVFNWLFTIRWTFDNLCLYLPVCKWKEIKHYLLTGTCPDSGCRCLARRDYTKFMVTTINFNRFILLFYL